jgi:hypothetical protein
MCDAPKFLGLGLSFLSEVDLMPTLFEHSEMFGVNFALKLSAHGQYLTCDNHPIHVVQAWGEACAAFLSATIFS